MLATQTASRTSPLHGPPTIPPSLSWRLCSASSSLSSPLLFSDTSSLVCANTQSTTGQWNKDGARYSFCCSSFTTTPSSPSRSPQPPSSVGSLTPSSSPSSSLHSCSSGSAPFMDSDKLV